MAQDALASMLTNLSSALQGLEQTFLLLAAVVGLWLIGRGLLQLRSTPTSPGRPIVGLSTLFVGMLLFSLKALLDAASRTLFEQEAALNSQLNLTQGTGIIEPYVQFAVTIVVLLGIYSVLKGLLYLQRSSAQEQYVWSALSHLGGGIICINIITFAKIVGNSAGGVLQDLINKLFS